MPTTKPPKSVFQPESAADLKARILNLRADSKRDWGTMTPAQAIAHTATAMQMAVGDTAPRRMFIGRIIGGFVKSLALRDDEPLKRNSPTMPELKVAGEPDLAAEQRRLIDLIDRFATAGPAGCTTHPHSFFGPMTPEEWGVLTYKHVDHHLRQFGA
ncbi:MAG: DUF1569 domain-containing protein [Gemmatimonadaceae bacterium]|nr:DUF1569 domain-containing protein [Gemmatimonadaceae bacterium]